MDDAEARRLADTCFSGNPDPAVMALFVGHVFDAHTTTGMEMLDVLRKATSNAIEGLAVAHLLLRAVEAAVAQSLKNPSEAPHVQAFSDAIQKQVRERMDVIVLSVGDVAAVLASVGKVGQG